MVSMEERDISKCRKYFSTYKCLLFESMSSGDHSHFTENLEQNLFYLIKDLDQALNGSTKKSKRFYSVMRSYANQCLDYHERDKCEAMINNFSKFVDI